MPPTLHSALLLTPSLRASIAFYSGVLGLPAVHAGAGWARLSLGGGASLLLQEASAPAASASASAAPAPAVVGAVLQFCSGGGEFDTLLPSLLQAGGVLDSPVQFAPAGKLAVLRAPAAAGGHMITLREEDEDGLAAAPARLA